MLRVLGMFGAALALVLGSAALASPAQASVHSLANVGAPQITGLPIVGDQLVASTGVWKGAAPLFYSFAWRSPSNSLLSGTADYTPRTADIGQVLTVRVTVQDGDNNSAYVDVSTAPVTASDVISKSPPRFHGGLAVGDRVTVSHGKFTSGSGVLSYAYQWSTSDGQTSTPLTDTEATHIITKSDLGLYLTVTVTATSPTQHGSATARTAGAVVPAIPFASDAALTNANRGRLTGKASNNIATITDQDGSDGDGVFVYGYSKPTVLGWFALDGQRKFSVNFLGLSVGEHKLVVISQSGTLVGWLEVDRTAGSLSLGPTSDAPIGIAAAIFVVLLVIALVIFSRLRRAKPRASRRPQ